MAFTIRYADIPIAAEDGVAQALQTTIQLGSTIDFALDRTRMTTVTALT
jgi:hypothetical protein